MPSFHSATTDQRNALRSGGWAGELRFAVCPNSIVFQATVNQTITANSFISFAWDNALQGAYTDVVVGMTFMITATDDAVERRNPLLRGRVSQDPTGTLFYCNESAINLTDGMIVTVLATFEVLQKDRIGNLVDGWQAFEDLAPVVKNMQSFYYFESDVEGQFSFAPVGQAMAQGATITAYHWTIDGAVYDVGDDDTQDITVTVGYGHHWAYLDVTDTNDTTFRFIFEILVCLRDDPAFMYTAHDNVSLSGGIENGWNVSTTFFAGIDTLLNRTRCAIVVFDIPKVGDLDLFSNVAFVGYIVQESTDVTADALSSLLSQTVFELQSFAAIAGQLPVPSLAIRNVAVPTAWEQITLPTSQRVIAHLMTRYSTFANLCAVDVLYTDSTWFAGEMDLEAGTLLDSINRIGEEIQAKLVFFPQGDAAFEINANFEDDTARDALPTLMAAGNLEPQDVFAYSLPIPYYKTVGQVEAGCATFYTDGSTPVKLDALAPATARQEGNERPVVLAQLLEANLTQAEAVTAAKQRIGDLLEYLNPATNLPATLKDGWHCLTPSTRVWLTYDLPATDSTRGLPVAPSSRWLLYSVSLTWQIATGAWDVQGTSRIETRGGLAQQAATISPNVIDTSLPVLPILSDYDAFAPDASLNYTSTDPDAADVQPYSPSDMAQFTPLTTEDAANVADNTPGSTCALVSPAVNFRSNATRYTPRTTTIGATYTISVKGRAQISDAVWQHTFNFRLTDGGFVRNPDPLTANGQYGHWVAGVGWIWNDAFATLNYRRSADIVLTGIASTTFTYFQEKYNYTGIPFVPPGSPAFVALIGSNALWVINDTAMPSGTNLYQAWTGSYTDTSFRIGLDSSVNNAAAIYGGDLALTELTVRGTGTNPFTGAPAIPLYSDAFYTWQVDDAGKIINVNLNSAGGLRVNSLPLAVAPEYNENGAYQFTYTGDGNQIPFSFLDSDYSNNQSLPLYIQACGPNMGS